MNPFNLLINYVIASSRASFYNVPGNQEITNTGLLTGMVSENPLMSYLIIDNKAKIEGEKAAVSVTDTTQSLPAPVTGGTGTPDAKNTTETTQANSAGETGAVNVVTLEKMEAEISKSTIALQQEIAKIPENNRIDLQKIIAETLNPKIESLEKSNAALNTIIAEINKRLDAISAEKQTPDVLPASKNIVSQKGSPKTDTK